MLKPVHQRIDDGRVVRGDELVGVTVGVRDVHAHAAGLLLREVGERVGEMRQRVEVAPHAIGVEVVVRHLLALHGGVPVHEAVQVNAIRTQVDGHREGPRAW